MASSTSGIDGERMPFTLRSPTTIADCAHELQLAAGELQDHASDRSSVPALPAALAHLEEALDRLATSMLKTAQTVEEWECDIAPGNDESALSPDARALRWHLFHLANRLRGAQDACPDTRQWARGLLRKLAPDANHARRGVSRDAV
jgi:hypothetical protein